MSRAIFAGVLFLFPAASADAGPSDERGAIMKALAGRVGLVLGAASSCPNIPRARIDAIADKISGVIKSSDESASIFELFNKSKSEGARSVAAKQTDCAATDRQLADLESASSPDRQASTVPAPATAQPAGFTGQDVAIAVRGVTANEIRFGASGPLTGPSKDYGQQIRFGIEAAFRAANDAGGVHGRMLRFIMADDGYEPVRTPETLKQLYEKDQVFGFIGNFGTPTAEISLPFALERRMLSFASYSGANLLRRDPPDHYVFNYRPSYSEETDAAVRYLVKIRRLKPEQIAVFAQQDAYGDAGFNGVAKAMRVLRGGDAGFILRLGYARNTVDVDGAVAQLKASKTPIKGMVMQATYRPAAQFIAKTHDAYPGLIYTNPSTVGSNSLREELSLLGPKFMAGVIITQVVPAIDGYSALVLRYKDALSKYFGGEAADFISLEYYVAAQALIEGLKRAGPQIDTERLIESLESIHDLDLGLGTPVNFNGSEHQASHKIWGTQMNESGKLEPIELQ
jgi:branched-chain amino acid transport system substrate-binding protein